jgi:large subunit ribosomal protein L2
MVSDFADCTTPRSNAPEKTLLSPLPKKGGRNHHGITTTRFRGGGHKRMYRKIDFKRKRDNVEAVVVSVEYDPCRSARIALLQYPDNEKYPLSKAYIIAPNGLKAGDKVMSGETDAIEPRVGNCMPLWKVPLGMTVHNIELTPGRGGQMVRSAGGAATLMSRDEGYATIRLPSGEVRRVHETCYATIGQVGNIEHENIVLGKAGRSRHRGIRPINRGVSRNPVDHPNGGGAGKSKSGGGWQQLTSPWGLLAKGYRTRNKRKHSNRFILVRRDGRPMKQR